MSSRAIRNAAPDVWAKRILTSDDVGRITDKFQVLNPYDPDEVPELLNLTDDNDVCKCSHELKSEHDDVGVCEVRGCNCKREEKTSSPVVGSRHCSQAVRLFEKIFDQNDKLTDIKIVNPKAHGIGFLYPPKDNPKGWKKDAPLWVYEMWDYIVRGLSLLQMIAFGE